ncbi:hypothetical protein FRC08_007066, partial [Ceratobasidium sp. 394]
MPPSLYNNILTSTLQGYRRATPHLRFPPASADPFEQAHQYAHWLIPDADLDYIPRKEQDIHNWVDDWTYRDPKRGLLIWCHSGAPKTKAALTRTAEETLDWVVKEVIQARVREDRERWQNACPSHDWGQLDK